MDIIELLSSPGFKRAYWVFAITFCVVVISYLYYFINNATACACRNPARVNQLTYVVGPTVSGCRFECESRGYTLEGDQIMEDMK